MKVENPADPVAAFAIAVGCLGFSSLSAEQQLAEIRSLIFSWVTGNPRHIGVMADEVEKYAPHAVEVDPASGYKVVNYGALFETLRESVMRDGHIPSGARFYSYRYKADVEDLKNAV